MTRLEVLTRGRDTIFDVNAWPSRALALHVYSSVAGAVADVDRSSWRDEDLVAISQRLAKRKLENRSGEEKGRVLYVAGWYGLPFRLEMVAAALLHLPRRKGKPLEIYRMCYSSRLNI